MLEQIMAWNIAQAKQQFSELVRMSVEEPQAIYNRDRAVATVVSAQEYEEFVQWRQTMRRVSLLDQFERGRLVFAEAFGQLDDPLPLMDRSSLQRVDPFSQ